ncbi:GntR family transcriptional regulator [Acuticoccus sediminis]|uniref:GntR family transcriptional regulator n=1 Tax=Acuticoccus sediminis TaxID=2184697 RepID=A0A8B2P080_9HYPH|nr:GntR family transcriptional regulator [Acuticoccus sediminis]RAI01667.1 GntR family transcriptional regulator [Acuticoccus sediminis]
MDDPVADAGAPLQKRSADSSERAYETIRKLLVEFRLRPEERINEVQLSRTLGLSRTPIREALNRLASEGFVELSPNRGFHVRPLSTEGLLDLYELRSIVECAAFQLMCKRADPEDLADFGDFWASVRDDYRDRDPDEILELDETFHMMLAELSGNQEIPKQLSAINARIRFIRRIQIEHVTHDTGQVLQHDAIVDAAMKRDVEAGTAALRSHIEITVSATQQAMKDALLKIYESGTSPFQQRKKRAKRLNAEQHSK